ncbi:glycosyltransferase [Cytobacillus sp. FJAT-54145]|uniref:Glycosyltransferase n=1 Tax=Cytobacillus spartinae TaxID=3299023 RepID=A0ABW6K5B0_9BACI
MNIVLATPNFHQPRGNTVTVQRIADGLKQSGHTTEIISMTEDSTITSLPKADLVHGFHAYRFFKFKERLNHDIHPYVVTITGTDLNHDLFNEDKREHVILSLTEASAIHVFDEEARQVLVKEIPSTEPKLFTIPQGIVAFPPSQLAFQKEKGTFLFVLPAGIRKVKNVSFAINMLRLLHEKQPHIRLCIVGPVIEEEEGRHISYLVEENNEWVTYLGSIPHVDMGTIYSQTDALLNTSISEGQSSAILEAMGHGLPVLVSDNQGNRNIVHHNQTGLVYRSQHEFLDYAENLVNNNEMRIKLGQSAQSYIDSYHSGKFEVESILKMYEFVFRNQK